MDYAATGLPQDAKIEKTWNHWIETFPAAVDHSLRGAFAGSTTDLELDEAQPSESIEETAEDREAFDSLCRKLMESTVKKLRLIAENSQPVPVGLICAEMLCTPDGFSDEWIREEMDESVAEAAEHLRELYRLLKDKRLYDLNESDVKGLAREARLSLMADVMNGIQQYREEISEIDHYKGGRSYWLPTIQGHVDSARIILHACCGTDVLFESRLGQLLQETQGDMDRFARTIRPAALGLAPA